MAFFFDGDSSNSNDQFSVFICSQYLTRIVEKRTDSLECLRYPIEKIGRQNFFVGERTLKPKLLMAKKFNCRMVFCKTSGRRFYFFTLHSAKSSSEFLA